MSSMAAVQSCPAPADRDLAALLARAEEVQAWLRGRASEIEQRRSLPPEVAERLVDAGLFRITQPSLYGGLGMDTRAAWQAVYQIARGCSSTAWVLGLSSANVVMIGKFPDQAQREVFLSGRPTIVSLLTGGVGHDIEVEPVAGGMLLSGRWRYASGIDVATWAGLLVPIPVDGKPVMHVVLVPADAFAIDHQSWNVLGMRGTGSKDIALSKTFVPDHRWMNWQVLQEGGRHATCPHHGPISDAPLNAINAMSTLAPTLGVASAVAEEFRAIVRAKVSPAAQKALVEDRVAQIEVATSEATLAMLRRALLDDADEIVLQAERTGGVSLIDRAAIRTRIAVASRLALRTAQAIFAALGGSVLPQGTRIERLFRDVHAMSSHLLLQPDMIGEAYGRLLLDLPLPPTARI
ncbi:acyl-CoA dehydrogenase family protein [Bradyrhizobium sp. NP1]|uniref:acyl-CoA dehydrogenase family protein n=1 Tax=Bradyrhizobium sp. NP1 TaxID=3049772 RepID=UPI0025A53A6A|nr:acyl-CoA dehydrogenase family protein [Bradyrhizobium sp. NP1]WJR79964.1 acyl-CoA dehydrogenase family protein [Bradyrhizobium sp. NP1]